MSTTLKVRDFYVGKSKQLNQNLVDIVYSDEGSNFYFDSSGFVLVYQKDVRKTWRCAVLKHPK